MGYSHWSDLTAQHQRSFISHHIHWDEDLLYGVFITQTCDTPWGSDQSCVTLASIRISVTHSRCSAHTHTHACGPCAEDDMMHMCVSSMISPHASVMFFPSWLLNMVSCHRLQVQSSVQNPGVPQHITWKCQEFVFCEDGQLAFEIRSFPSAADLV